MVLTWQKPKYAPFEEQAQLEQADSALLLLLESEADAAETLANTSDFTPHIGESANCFQVDLLEGWFKV